MRSCPENPERPKTRGELAALWARDNGANMVEAAAKFQITRQTVDYARKRMGLAPPRSDKLERTLDILREHAPTHTARQIEEKFGIHHVRVYILTARHGIALKPHEKLEVRCAAEIEAGLAEIRAGTLTVAGLAARLDVSEAHLIEALRGRGPGRGSRRGRNYKHRDEQGRSRSERAAALVDAGWKISAAARELQLSTRAVRLYLQRRERQCAEKRLDTPTGLISDVVAIQSTSSTSNT